VSGRARHLAEERLFDCYVAERAGEAVDPPAAEHLADCAECGSRYAELTRFMDGLRTDADAEAGEVFPADWQEAQRQSIARRIEHVGHVARVISFPGRLVARHMTGKGGRIAVSPWAAAAAAASLFLGVVVGMFYDGRKPVTSVAVARPAQPAPQQAAAVSPVVFDTDAFLSELERALGGPRTPELMSLDVLTPHAREVVLDSR
jgi:hypothetical protein